MKTIILSGLTVDDLIFHIEAIFEAKMSSQIQKKTEKESQYITRKEVASLLKVSLPTLHDWTKLGWLKSYKIGNRVLYKKDEVEQSLNQVLFQKGKKGGVL